MYDERWFKHRYSLYRPTLGVTSAEQRMARPASATSTDNRCRFVPKPGRFAHSNLGVDLAYDAVMLVPHGSGLRPEQGSQFPDQVYADSRYWIVLGVYDAGGESVYERVFLSEAGGGEG